jgi:N-acetylglucosaminyldiphosphoundecaprenol N-acetyl-beta-D-mannosaminyltransferase
MSRIEIFGTKISITNLKVTVNIIQKYIFTKPSYICFPDSYVAVKANQDQKLQKILNNAFLTLPDGKPIEFYSKLHGVKDISTVSGYWLCKNLLNTNLSHFFYGSNEDKLLKMKTNIFKEFPNANILGFLAAPFLYIEQINENPILLEDIKYINSLKPDLIWIGISSPKQDYLMSEYVQYLDQGLMLGVGGVFDYLSGYKKISPEWIKKLGLRWLYRLFKEPKRLWKKYLVGISVFIYLLVKEFTIKNFKRISK